MSSNVSHAETMSRAHILHADEYTCTFEQWLIKYIKYVQSIVHDTFFSLQ